ncbi:MFS transporter [Rathayibacter caricis]|uniref:MFS transporter n=1 Tax=Rathayibacter caricis TaxID=110936 RepID=UPI001FB23B84|nr:MFS transporter [Rathayibacter caricis]MCJ1696974.1 MFS transporter [Rathayibacter caricis]
MRGAGLLEPGRRGVALAYAFNGFALASWTARLPGIRAAGDLDAAGLGVLLTAGAIGTLLTVPVAGRLVARLGALRTYRLATLVFAAAYLLLAVALLLGQVPLLLVGNAVHGVAFALTNVPQSILAAGSERRVGRTILPQFHAGYSIGSALGALLGGASSAVGVSPAAQFLALAVAAVVVRWSIGRHVAPLAASLAHERRSALAARAAALVQSGPVPVVPRGSRRFGLGVWTHPQVLLLGLIVFAAALSEGTATNWSAVAVVDAFGVTEADASLGITVFLVAQTVLRLTGGPLIDRLGRVRVLTLSCAAAVAGIALFVLAPGFPAALAGLALWGAGSALAVPIGIAAAAADPIDGPSRVAAVTSLSSVANIAGPPAIGALAVPLGVRPAMLAVSVVVAAAVAAAPRALRPRR